MIRINEIIIKGVGPIRDLHLSFDNHFNIICGQNGVGKTTILDCIAQSFCINELSLKKHSLFEKGEWTLKATIDKQPVNRSFNVEMFSPSERIHTGQGIYNKADQVIVFKTHRDIPYSALASINSDPKLETHEFVQKTLTGALSNDLKNWFVNRHLWSAHANHLDANQLANISLAKYCFGLLNPSIKFSKIVPATNDILLSTDEGEIYFEYLSSGYKSCLAVLIGLIKEIELRNQKISLKAADFDGIVLIDEIDLHLHPEWQAKMYVALKEILPQAQIFTTTHSPHLVQVASPLEVIPLIRGENFSIVRNEALNKEYGCQGWSIEEILTDVMGMTETRTPLFNELINSFNRGLDDEDLELANKSYEKLSRMLHPDSSLKKILNIQLVGVGSNDQA